MYLQMMQYLKGFTSTWCKYDTYIGSFTPKDYKKDTMHLDYVDWK